MSPEEYAGLQIPTVETARRAIRATGTGIRQPGGTSPSVPTAPPVLQEQTINLTVPGTFVIIPGYPGMAIHVFQVDIFSDVAQNYELWNGAVSLTGGPYKGYPANTPLFRLNTGEPHFKLDPGNDFKLTISAAGQISGVLLYRRF